jgi:DNA-binding protein Fis
MKESIIINIESDLLAEVMKYAKIENQNLSAFISFILRDYIEIKNNPQIPRINFNFSNFQLPPGGLNLEKLMLTILEKTLEVTDNNQSEAARLLGLTRAKLRSLMKHLE